jgi:hypothetical protein
VTENSVVIENPGEFTKGRVLIGGVELPGYIDADNGIEVIPGCGTDINRLRVTFLVGDVKITSADEVLA